MQKPRMCARPNPNTTSRTQPNSDNLSPSSPHPHLFVAAAAALPNSFTLGPEPAATPTAQMGKPRLSLYSNYTNNPASLALGQRMSRVLESDQA